MACCASTSHASRAERKDDAKRFHPVRCEVAFTTVLRCLKKGRVSVSGKAQSANALTLRYTEIGRQPLVLRRCERVSTRRIAADKKLLLEREF